MFHTEFENPKRIYGLDILRAFAIIFVMYGHGISFLKNYISIDTLLLFSFDGVALFFVLSGFLIGRILISTLNKEGLSKKVLINFWIKRWMRTLPNYFLILTFLAILHFYFSNLTIKELFPYYFFSQNIFTSHPWFFPEAWSLSVEEWFYLLIPICLFFLIKFFNLSVNQSILWTALFILIMSTLSRYYISINVINGIPSGWEESIKKVVITRIDSIMYGIIGAFVSLKFIRLWKIFKWHFFFIGFFILSIHKYLHYYFHYFYEDYSIYYDVLSFSLISFGTLLLLPLLDSIKKGKGILFKSITIISLISYSMYLINLTLIKHAFIPLTFKLIPFEIQSSVSQGIGLILFWSYTIVVSIIIYLFFEKPILTLRTKICSYVNQRI